MRSSLFLITTLALTCCIYILNRSSSTEKETSPEPSDYLWAQRAFPYGDVPSEAYYQAVAWSKSTIQHRDNELNWTLAGPLNVGGRITDVAMHVSDLQTIYAATASGGIWKSVDTGNTWQPVGDALPSLSIGDIAIDPSNKQIIYAGTGEPNGGGGSVTYDGRGLFKSADAGQTWQSLGLDNTGNIARIAVDPQHPERIFVAATGKLFSNNPERGIFRSTDGGQNWQKCLFVNDSTGGIDLAIHPLHPDTIYAATWQRTRRPNKRVYGGPGCAIWRSTDGGDSWTKLQNGLPQSNIGRIGIDISASEPNILYAIYADEQGNFKGVYNTLNGGDNWNMVNDGDPGYPGFGWWFGQIRIHPSNAQEVYTLGLDWVKTSDGGQFWSSVSDYLHADYHAFYIHPVNPALQIAGNDGGLYISKDNGSTWDFRPFPCTQFYASEINYKNPALFSGGLQDNGSWRSLFGGLNDWEHFAGGDGFVTLINPEDTSIYYAESQYGGFNGSNGAEAPASSRYNWNTPYILDPNNPYTMYIGADRLFRSDDAGLSWTAISGDLSNGPTGQNGVRYGAIATISASKVDEQVLWAGTDDGNVWVTNNGGSSWSKVSTSLPKRWISRVVADPSNANTALVCLSGFRHNDNMAHLYRTLDQGQHWQDVSGNLPDVPINDLIIDPADPENTWYVATDAGVNLTHDGGLHWEPCDAGIPTVPITDLTLHEPTRTIIAATYGRALFKAQLPPPAQVHAPAMHQVRVGPNPTSGPLHITFELPHPAPLQIALYHLNGQKVADLMENSLGSGPQALETSVQHLPAGVYLLQCKSGHKILFCKKIIRQ